jgi:predicted transcriptional regulator
MTRIERIAPYLEALSDDAFEDFLAAAVYAAGPETVYASLSHEEKAEIDAAIARLDAGEGVSYDEVKARLFAKLKAAGR